MAITERKTRGFARVAAALLLLCVCASPSLGENKEKPYALIFGTVWNSQQQPVYGVHIRVRRANEKKFRWEAFSDHRGEFGIRVPEGSADYVLVPDVKRSKHASAPETKVHVVKDERVDIGIHLSE